MQIINELEALRLEVLASDWVNTVYDSEFLECEELPSEYEAVLDAVDVQAALDGAISALHDTHDLSWTDLSHRIERRNLFALLFYFIDYGNKNVLTLEYRARALSAARLYYGLLCVAGYRAYGVYHAQLLTHSLLCFAFPQTMVDQADGGYSARDLVRDLNHLLKELRLLMKNFKAVMLDLQPQPADMNFEDILSSLLDVVNGSFAINLNIDKLELEHVCGEAYKILDDLVCGVDGAPIPAALRLLFKCLLPKLQAVCNDNKSVVRATYTTYASMTVARYGAAALDGYGVLLQHLCHHLLGLERTEVRSARATLVVGMANCLPRRAHADFIAWVLQLMCTARAAHRMLATEIVAKLLTDSAAIAAEHPSHENSPSVTSLSESSQDRSPQEEQCSVSARAHPLPYAALLDALTDRTDDVSGWLRARALRALADCVRTNVPRLRRIVQDAFGANSWARAVALAARCLSDERAAVRRDAVALLETLLVCHEELLDDTNLGLLVSVCRDASVLVRGAAVTALGELALKRPRPSLLDAFLDGPMRQLGDPEAKVQAQVLSLVREMVLERLRPCESTPSEEELPWSFLAAVVRHNMRRHLQKACTMLATNAACVNDRVVDVLSTHLRTSDEARLLQSLMLLSCVARHVDCSENEFLFDLYYKLVNDTRPAPHDERLLPLVLELLTEWSCWLRQESRYALRLHLIECVREARAAVAPCRPACVSLAAHLDPADLQWANDLMHAFAARALAGSDAEVEAAVCAADVSLVAPTPPPDAFVRSLVAAAGAATHVHSATARGRLVAALGRVCLRSRVTAAEAAPALADTLSCCNAPLAARLNSLLALADICTRYTCIMEPLLGTVCSGLDRDAPPELRRAAARALTRLLLGGYLRLRPPLYFRYCALLADEQREVREPVEYYVSCCLPADTIYHHLVDCVRYYSRPALPDVAPDHSPELCAESRQLIYDVMLQRLTTGQRLQVQCRLARELLLAAAGNCDEDEPLPASVTAALLDTIALLSGPRMRLPRRATDADDDLAERVTANIVSAKMKRTVAEVVVPAVLRLHARLRPAGGQLAARLVRFATELLADYRQEIEELIETDEELVERVRHFQQTEGVTSVASVGNRRNLVTSSAAPEPETPLSPPRRRLPRLVARATVKRLPV